MFLKKLSLHNVRCIKHLDLSFESDEDNLRQWTLLLGENGTGKSTILRAIAMLLAGEGLPELIGAKPDCWIRHDASEATLHAEFVAPGKGSDCGSITLKFQRGDKLRRFLDRNRKQLDRLEDVIGESRHRYLTVGYGASRRLSGDGTIPWTKGEGLQERRARCVATLFEADAVLNPLKAWAIDQHYRREEEGLQMIRRTFKGILPGVEFLKIDRNRQELMFRTGDGVVPLKLLSDGYQIVAAWWGDLLYRITDIVEEYDDPLQAQGLLLIDEIELHLHPVWQRELRDRLTEKLPRFQIVATTHSPLTAQQADEGELFFLNRPDPTAAPKLEPYHGNPRYLLIQQMVTSPAFGLSTAKSKYVEDLREEYRGLIAREKRSRGDEKRLRELREELADQPDPTIESPHARERRELLEEIKQSLAEREQ